MDNDAIFVKRSIVKNAIFIFVILLCLSVMINRFDTPSVSDAVLLFGIFSMLLLVFIVVLSDIRFKRMKLFYEALFISEVVEDDASSEILTTTIKGFKYISQVSKSEYEDFLDRLNKIECPTEATKEAFEEAKEILNSESLENRESLEDYFKRMKRESDNENDKLL